MFCHLNNRGALLHAFIGEKTRAKNGENGLLLRVASVAKHECDLETNWMRPAPTRMIRWCLCNTTSATASWASVDLDGFLEQTALDNWSIKALVAWRGGLFLTEGKIGVLSVSSLFLTRVGVYGCVCVCIRTHTHTLQRWGTWMWAQKSGWDTWRAQRMQMD